MDLRIVLAAIASLQLGVLILVLALVRVTGRKLVWLTLSAAIAVVFAHSVWTLVHAFRDLPPGTPASFGRWVNLAAMTMAFFGFLQLVPLFREVRSSAVRQREAETRFRQLADASFEGIVVHEGGLILDVNPALTEMLGFTRQELIGGNVIDFIAADSRERVARSMQEGDEQPYEHTVVRKDGRILQVEARGKSTSYDGRTVRVTALRDVTERRAAQARLQRAHQELEIRVRERTAELQRMNEQLRREIDQRANAEAALIRTTRELTDFVENVSIGLHWLGPDGRILWANKAELQLLGYARDEYVGHHIAEFHTDPEVLRELLECLARNEPLFDYPARLRCRDGRAKHVQISSNALYEDGKLVHTRCFTRDVSARTSAEQALGERLRLSALSGDIGVALTSEKDLPGMLRRCAESVVKRLDAAFARIWTLNAKDQVLELQASAGMYTHLNGPHSRIAVGTLKIGWIARERKAHLTNQVIDDSRISDSDWARREKMTSFAGYPLCIGDRLVGVIAMFSRQELSTATTDALGSVADAIALGIDRHQADLARRQSEQQLQAVLDNSTAVIYLKDAAGRYMLINRHFCELFHITLEQLRGRTDFEFFPAEVANAFRGNDLMVLEGGGPIEFEEVAPHDDGPHTYISLKFPFVDGAGVPYAVCGISTDITERKRAAEELKRAKEAAEAASRAKSVFLANISHEIRTPITAMLGAAELAGRGFGGDPHLGEEMDIILRNGRHQLAMIDDLLDISRAEAATMQVRRLRCALLDVLADVKALVQPLRRSPDVEFRILFETPVPRWLLTDPTRLKQSMINLVNNAFKFTQRGHVWIRVSARKTDQDLFLVIRVEDTGVGIPPAEHQRIFEPFAQVATGGSRASEGAGLGLSLSRWIAEQLGGGLEVESVENQGSTFTLSIAAGPGDDVEWMQPAEAEDACMSTGGPPTGKATPRLSGRVLLAEDFDDTRTLIERALSAQGVTITAVAGGEQAVAEGSAAEYDLVLMDLRMPGMDGIAATRELRRRGYLAPIIALTASISADDREGLLKAGFDDVWAKPMTLHTLVERTAAYLLTEAESTLTEARDRGPPKALAEECKRQLSEVSARFVEKLPLRLAALREAVQAGRSLEAFEILHQLVGSCGMHGFMDLSEEAARLSPLARDGRLANAPDLLERLGYLVSLATASKAGVDGPPGNA